MQTPGVSVVIPTLNEERYLPCLLESLRQIPHSLEVIVVDGASEDRTVAVVEKYQSLFPPNISLILIQSETRGISLQRNMGAARATHTILMFCDADIVMPSVASYERLIEAFVEQSCVVAAPVLRPIEKGTRLRLAYMVQAATQRTLLLLKRPYFAGSCLLTTKEIFDAVGGFDTNIKLGEDVDYCLRACRLGRPAMLDTVVLVSARRVIKYGYGWIFSGMNELGRLLLTGTVRAESVFYPFGEF